MKKLLSLAVLAVTVSAALPAAAQFAKAEDAIEYRQGAFAVLGHHFGRLGAMANGKMPYVRIPGSNEHLVHFYLNTESGSF